MAKDRKKGTRDGERECEVRDARCEVRGRGVSEIICLLPTASSVHTSVSLSLLPGEARDVGRETRDEDEEMW